MNNFDRVAENDPDFLWLKADGFDDCIIGTCGEKLVYSVSRILNQLIFEDEEPNVDGDDAYTRAREHFDFNIGGAYVGEQTPIFVEDEMLEDSTPRKVVDNDTFDAMLKRRIEAHASTWKELSKR